MDYKSLGFSILLICVYLYALLSTLTFSSFAILSNVVLAIFYFAIVFRERKEIKDTSMKLHFVDYLMFYIFGEKKMSTTKRVIFHCLLFYPAALLIFYLIYGASGIYPIVATSIICVLIGLVSGIKSSQSRHKA
ncbi:hypothetical protein [uncultured Microbulbifer sp.]|uniref:hypothetical protein n=1 Tax=uncultured Microbulbifer sp. TaxID=348147 RepID=UPI002604A292|nr:hypothetical protein [uncultured Microbulbifer sp.]